MGFLSRLFQSKQPRHGKIAHLLVMKRGPKPNNDVWYLRQVVQTLVPEALGDPSVQIKARWQTGQVDETYAIGAAFTDFDDDVGDTDKYVIATQEFSDADGDGGLLLKVFNKR